MEARLDGLQTYLCIHVKQRRMFCQGSVVLKKLPPSSVQKFVPLLTQDLARLILCFCFCILHLNLNLTSECVSLSISISVMFERQIIFCYELRNKKYHISI
jgi:hypothetical protein